MGPVKAMEEEMVISTCSRPLMERRARPQKEQALNCPRCNSTNTKFCYYNNYSLTQPRYFCKTCRRYWTEGGSLRNVPVGGGSRKNKRSSSSSSTTSSSSSASASSKKTTDPNATPIPSSSSSPAASSSFQSMKIHQGQDLNLAFHATQDYLNMPQYLELANSNNGSASAGAAATSAGSSLSALELLNGISSRGLSSFMPMQSQDSMVYPSGFGGLHDFKPSLNFPLDGMVGGGGGGGYGNSHDNGGRILFPFEDLKPVTNADFEQNRGHGDSSGYWSGMRAEVSGADTAIKKILPAMEAPS
ncbi:hypothetical protein ACLOJK_006209 [Asimina triloba]